MESFEKKGPTTYIQSGEPYPCEIEISRGKILGKKYIIDYKMAVSAGQADLYLCRYKEKTYVAKIYMTGMCFDQKIIDKLKK